MCECYLYYSDVKLLVSEKWERKAGPPIQCSHEAIYGTCSRGKYFRLFHARPSQGQIPGTEENQIESFKN